MVKRILIDGIPNDCIDAADRGLAYGDGVFRTLRVADGRPVAWSVQMQRLTHDCARLGLSAPDAGLLCADLERLSVAESANAVVKIIVTRQNSGRGYTPAGPASRRIVSLHPLPAHAGDEFPPLQLACSPVQLAIQPLLAGVKHLNRLEQVLARADCRDRGAEDALMCDRQSRVISTTMRNLLFVDHDGRWLTPALERSGVAGATRQRLLTARAAQGVPVAEEDILRTALPNMVAAIACNSVGGAVAVRTIDGCRLPGSDEMAEVARGLLEIH